jgi:putative addiction module CopG family antidote
MEVSLPTKLEQFVHAQVRAGRYVDADEVVRDALRRMQETDAPETASVMRDAMNIASQAQRDLLSLVQRADREQDVLHQLMGAASTALDASRDVARRIPVAREVEKVVSVSLEQVTMVAERGEQDARQLRQGLETTAKMLGVLASMLEKVNSTTAALHRGSTPP